MRDHIYTRDNQMPEHHKQLKNKLILISATTITTGLLFKSKPLVYIKLCTQNVKLENIIHIQSYNTYTIKCQPLITMK